MISDFSRSFFLFVVRWIILVGLYLFNTCTVGNLEVFTVVEMSWPWTRNFLHNWYVSNCKSFRASWDATSSSTATSRSATTKEMSKATYKKSNPARIFHQQGELVHKQSCVCCESSQRTQRTTFRNYCFWQSCRLKLPRISRYRGDEVQDQGFDNKGKVNEKVFLEDVKFELHPEGVKSRVLQEEAGGTSFRAYVHVDGRAWSKVRLPD